MEFREGGNGCVAVVGGRSADVVGCGGSMTTLPRGACEVSEMGSLTCGAFGFDDAGLFSGGRPPLTCAQTAFAVSKNRRTKNQELIEAVRIIVDWLSYPRIWPY